MKAMKIYARIAFDYCSLKLSSTPARRKFCPLSSLKSWLLLTLLLSESFSTVWDQKQIQFTVWLTREILNSMNKFVKCQGEACGVIKRNLLWWNSFYLRCFERLSFKRSENWKTLSAKWKFDEDIENRSHL